MRKVTAISAVPHWTEIEYLGNEAGETPLHLAIKNYEGDHRSALGIRGDVVSILLHYKANSNAVTNTGVSIMELACEKKLSQTLFRMFKSHHCRIPSLHSSGRDFMYHQMIAVQPSTLPLSHSGIP
jgi:ankyrin repeat protein